MSGLNQNDGGAISIIKGYIMAWMYKSLAELVYSATHIFPNKLSFRIPNAGFENEKTYIA